MAAGQVRGGEGAGRVGGGRAGGRGQVRGGWGSGPMPLGGGLGFDGVGVVCATWWRASTAGITLCGPESRWMIEIHILLMFLINLKKKRFRKSGTCRLLRTRGYDAALESLPNGQPSLL